MAVDINRIWIGFVGLRGTLDPVLYFSDVSRRTFVFKNAVYSFQVGDHHETVRALLTGFYCIRLQLAMELW